MNLLIILEMKKLQRMVKIREFLIVCRNRGGLILPLILLILLFSSCGITVPAYLNPPVYTGANLEFYHAYNNDPNNAIGYEFFYRIYDEETIDFTTVSNEAQSYFTATKLLGLLSNNRSIFEDSFYRRIFPVLDDIPTTFQNPAIAPIMIIDPLYFDKTNSLKRFTISINLNLLTPAEAKISTTSGYLPIGSYSTFIDFKRLVTSVSGGSTFIEVDFSAIDPINHDDVPGTATSTINIAVFVVLYGLTDQFVSIFSDVVYIGSEQYTF